ncbi:MAG: hypothetical protein CMB52_01405 [Euryarchaeota archaeon]|nr:hypothetical protein [Euryarchaeota archaeon]
MMDDFVSEFVMPEAPAVAATSFRRFSRGQIISAAASFALFAVSLMLVLFAVNLLSEGVLMVNDPELSERHNQFKELSGFDNVTTSGAGVDVCIVDTGFDTSHPDLSHVNLAGWSDFVQNREEPYDDEGHGTAMAGILVAENLLEGIAPGVNLYIAKAITSSGTGTDSDIAAAVDWCTESGVDIISLSLGGQQGINWILLSSDELENAVNRAINQGVYVVAAAGNDGGEDDDGDVSSPGSVEDVICVGAIDTDGTMWRNSSTGDNNGRIWPLLLPRSDPDRKPELVAPGEKIPILNAQIGGTDYLYAWGSGTSGATVWVTGALAHLLEHRPDLAQNGSSGGNRQTVEDVKQWMKESVQPGEGQEGHDDYYGYGRLQVDVLLSIAGN